MDIRKVKDEIGRRYQKALVTGGAGFIGSHVIEELLDSGIDVVSVDSFVAGKERNIEPFYKTGRFESIKCDVTDYDELKKAFDGVDVVFHQAASKMNVCLRDPRRDLDVNGKGAFNIMELSRDFHVKKVCHASTGSVYGSAFIFPTDENHPLAPLSYYGCSKLAGESYVKAFVKLYDMDASVMRYCHVYGPRQESGDLGGVIAIFCRAMLENKNPTIYGDGTQQRSFTYVKDVANANLFLAATDGTKGEAYNVASGLQITVGDLCNELIENFGKKGILAPKFEDWRLGDFKNIDISNKKLCDLGFEFQTDFETGLKKTADYYIELSKKGELN